MDLNWKNLINDFVNIKSGSQQYAHTGQLKSKHFISQIKYLKFEEIFNPNIDIFVKVKRISISFVE